ncbi:MAG: imidazoleglycerol-phosphate dehydratase HisB [Actinobacteria bacterium]|nr:imidazoleglycerol-phosphate dehydratase HisB [Actinomycetota bacterium]
MDRTGSVKRKTTETSIEFFLNLDGKGDSEVETGIPFLNHMLILFAKHGLFDMRIEAKGDLDIDGHHTVEDLGICLGQAIKECLGDKSGIERYGFSILPMDETLVLVSLDISGRPYLVYEVDLPVEIIGSYDTSLTVEFLQAVVNTLGLTLHVRLLSGKNTHHIIEAVFKALAKALSQAVGINPRISGIPSTKGML